MRGMWWPKAKHWRRSPRTAAASPASTRSSSPMPVATAAASSAGTSVMRSAEARGVVALVPDAAAPASATEPQA